MKKKLPAQFSNVFLIKSILPMKKKLTASQQTAQPDACTISCTASCVWWNCFVNFHRLRIIIPGAPLTCNTPAAAPPETKKTTLANCVIIKHDIIASSSRFFETKNRFRASFLAELFLRVFLGCIIQKHASNEMKKFILGENLSVKSNENVFWINMLFTQDR